MNFTSKDISVLIITYNRPEQIKECLVSLFNQTRPPLEAVIVDASEDRRTESVIDEFRDIPFSIKYFRSKPDKIEQRNFGAKQCSGSLLQLSDDDIVFYPDYFENVEKYLHDLDDYNFGGFIGSICDDAANHQKSFFEQIKTCISTIFQKMFFIYPLGEGKLIKSGQHQLIRNSVHGDRPKRIFVMGGTGCYRREVFKKTKFDPSFKGYAAGEDLDFSIRVSLKYNLYHFPAAVVYHKHIGSSNRNLTEIMHDKSLFLRLIFERYKKSYNMSVCCHVWALFGLALYSLLFKASGNAFIATIQGIIDFNMNTKEAKG
jgi:GT2 family glycosyltransferase